MLIPWRVGLFPEKNPVGGFEELLNHHATATFFLS